MKKCSKTVQLTFFIAIGKSVLILMAAVLILSESNISLARNRSDTAQTPDQFVSILMTGNVDDIINGIEKIENMTNNGHFVPLFRDLFVERTEKYPNLPWNIVSADPVKMQIVVFLAQSLNRDAFLIDHQEKIKIHRYAARSARNKNVEVRIDAIIALGYIGDEKDVPLILESANTNSARLRKYAIWSLFIMCGDRVEKALDQIEKTETDPSHRQNMKRIRRDLKDLYKRAGPDACKR